MFGPRVGLYTAGHPIDKDIRITGLEYGCQCMVNNVDWWNAVVLPGVHWSNNRLSLSGSVVTKHTL